MKTSPRTFLVVLAAAVALLAPIVMAAPAKPPKAGPAKPSGGPAGPAKPGGPPTGPALPVNEAQSYAAFTEGLQLFKQGNWEPAIKALERAVRDNSRNEQAWYIMGMAHLQLRHWPEAERCLQQAVSLNMRNYNAWVQLGECAASQGQFERAREYVRRILSFDQRSFYAYYALGVIDYREGKLGNAVVDFDRSRAVYEEFAPTWYNLAVCAYNQHGVQTAMQRIKKAVVLDPKKPLYMFLMGWYAMMTNDTSTGFLSFRNLFDRDKKGTVYTDTARAFLAMRVNNLAEARKQLDQALKKDPEMVKALVLDALLLAKDNKKEEAVAQLQEALEIDPLDYDARDVLMHMGVTPPPPRPARLPGQKSSVVHPTASPSGAPSGAPSTAPSGAPSTAPSGGPATAPSAAPSMSPMIAPPPPPGVPRR